ncbi:hypothetical protein C0993_012197, partial [Termitomyces sp. T159_Od127]
MDQTPSPDFDRWHDDDGVGASQPDSQLSSRTSSPALSHTNSPARSHTSSVHTSSRASSPVLSDCSSRSNSPVSFGDETATVPDIRILSRPDPQVLSPPCTPQYPDVPGGPTSPINNAFHRLTAQIAARCTVANSRIDPVLLNSQNKIPTPLNPQTDAGLTKPAEETGRGRPKPRPLQKKINQISTMEDYLGPGAVTTEQLVFMPPAPGTPRLTPAQKAAITRKTNKELAIEKAKEREMRGEITGPRRRVAGRNADGTLKEMPGKRRANENVVEALAKKR